MGKQTIGYKYKLGMHLGLCLGPIDAIEKIVIADREAWSGSATGGRITIDKPELFGGESREGGVGGDIDVLMGETDQPANDYLLGVMPAPVPAFRKILTLVLRQFYIGNNPYLKNWRLRLKRTQTGHDGNPIWEAALADVGGNLNPAHLTRELMLSEEFGLGYPINMVDQASFLSAAQTLKNESFGLSFYWSQQEQVEVFNQRVLDHINGQIYSSPRTGKFVLNLIRDDYVVEELPLFDQSNILALLKFSRRGWGETINEITVIYTDPDNGKDRSITVQHLANIQMQGAVVAKTQRYPGIRDPQLAARVAQRDLHALASPVAQLRIDVNRSAWNLGPTAAFRFTWPGSPDVPETVFRVVQIDQGGIASGKITIDAVEDVFALPDVSYGADQASSWNIPNATPQPALYERVVEVPYWDVRREVGQADIANLDPDFGFVMAMAVAEPGDYYGFRMHVSGVAQGGLADVAAGDFCPTAELSAAIGPAVNGDLTNVVVDLSVCRNLADVDLDTYAYIDDELVAVRAVDTVANTITVDRGVLDTVPQAHLAGARVWFADEWHGLDPTERVEAEQAQIKLLTKTSLGQLEESAAATLSLTLNNRYQRPYPPGNFRINSQRYPVAESGDLVLDWAHRDRILQTATLNHQEEGSIGPEPGTTYSVTIYNAAVNPRTLMHVEGGLAGVNWTYTQAQRHAHFGGVGPHEIEIEIASSRDGLVCWQAQVHRLIVSDV